MRINGLLIIVKQETPEELDELEDKDPIKQRLITCKI